MPKALAEMTNPGGIGAAIKAREARLGDAQAMLASGATLDGVRLTPNRASRLRHTVRTLEAELAILYDRRAIAARATAQRAPAAKLSDWE